MSRLVLSDGEMLGVPFGINLAWRIGTYDVVWGNTRDDASLRRLLHDPEWKQHCPITIIDERVRTASSEPLIVPDWWAQEANE